MEIVTVKDDLRAGDKAYVSNGKVCKVYPTRIGYASHTTTAV